MQNFFVVELGYTKLSNVKGECKVTGEIVLWLARRCIHNTYYTVCSKERPWVAAFGEFPAYNWIWRESISMIVNWLF